MATTTWTLTTEGTKHTVRLVHSFWSGKRDIWLDGTRIIQKKIRIDYGLRHFFTIEGDEYELVIAGGLTSFSYFLLNQNAPIPSDKEMGKGVIPTDLLQARPLKDIPFWMELGRKLGLNYHGNKNADFFLRHRLVGIIDGYLILFTHGILSEPTREGWSLVIRHSPPSSSEMLKKLRQDPRLKQILARMKPTDRVLDGNADYTWIFLPVVKQETPAQLAARVSAFQNCVAEWARPLPEMTCENKKCRQPQVKDRLLALINGFPSFLCKDCVDSLPQKFEESKKTYEKSPNLLLPGALAALGVSILGSVIIACITALIDLSIMLGIFLCFANLHIMDFIGTKRSKRSLAIAEGLALVGITLGEFLILFLVGVRYGVPISLQSLLQSWTLLFSTGPALSALVLSYIFSLAYSGFYFVQLLRVQRTHLSRVFSPTVEIIPGNY
jgi:hypothetical protein